MASRQDKLKLTETGAAAARAWMQSRGWTLERLAQAAGLPHAMAASRALKRQGWLTLEQVAKVVALAGGELTAAQLVGLDVAAAVPVLPLAAPGAPPTSQPPQRAPPGPAAAGPGTSAEDVVAASSESLGQAIGDEALAVLVAGMRHAPIGSPEARRYAQLVREHVVGKARQVEEQHREEQQVSDQALMRKLNLVYAQWTGRAMSSIEAEQRYEFEGEGLA